jgi:predicted Rossmann-fold nucleotide-binding protein
MGTVSEILECDCWMKTTRKGKVLAIVNQEVDYVVEPHPSWLEAHID